ncbi:TonB-dependent receptor plug domain-containing protein [Flavobacterium terrigena]|uniref:Outer membrane receptor for ferrienterochelin and colicins n=1 Tax=Flavobacterium terrigena TaxID=402734 RepID=A0A1H6VKM1_9FLAO|nr:TonB-dependent receptor [Flavobacterium terrigena]SEJ01290.1 outer membrane receptor for ferrienterochelin and colicins [Flavobacterium terrigena]
MQNLRFILFLLVFKSFSQNEKKDTIQAASIKEVVITGQFAPQAIKKSIFNVRLISAKDIQNLAANNLSDVLSQYLNITVRPSGTNGRSTVSLFGLDAQYFKILVDNVPLVNEAGLGNNTDLSQINLNDIEQIEIVEGSMGVTHGANAVSGVLNIVTKKSSQNKWNISATAQEETIKDEYSLFERGKHIQALKVSHNINDNWFVSLGANRNDFQGFLDDKKGENYSENDKMRGFRWLPKEQLNSTALLSYHKNNFNFFYKFEYLDETIDFYNSTVQSGYNTQLGSYRYASDKRYLVNRYFHNLNATGKILSKLNYNVSLSHQKQTRNVEDFRYYLQNKSEANNVIEKDQSMEVLYSTGTLSNFFSDKKVDLQLGYEIVNNKGFSLVQEANNIIIPIRKTLENYDFFISSEIKATEKFSIRPGMRFSTQSKFKDQYASSLGLRYLFEKGMELRGSYGNSFRTPSFEELYSKQIFDGHFFAGNENLIPETSTSYEMSLKKTSFLASELQISNTFSGSFLDVNDRIDMALVRFNADTGNPEYEYINISKYRMWNFSTMNQFKKDNWSFTIGASVIGISQKIENQVFASNEKYLYSMNLNSSVSYSVPKWKTTFSTYYKLNGKSQQFIEGTSEYIISTVDSSSWLDASIRKTFFKDKLETTIGARNLLNVTSINQTKTNEGAGHATSSQIMLAYGRSYFLKLTYNLNF